GGRVAARFPALEGAAAGGRGRVCGAVDGISGADVAVKVLRSEDVMEPARFAREAALLARLDDPGIVRYITHGVEGGSQYLVMEWVAGERLARRMQASGLAVDEPGELPS